MKLCTWCHYWHQVLEITCKMHDSVSEVIKNIDKNYKLCKNKKLSRFSNDWDTWSTKVNKELRKQIEAGHPLKAHLQYIFMYWVNRSQLLELHHRNPKPRKNRIRKIKLSREGVLIRSILKSNVLVAYDMSYVEFAESSLGDLLHEALKND